MTILYRGRCVRITHEVMEVWCPTYQRYTIHDLRELRAVIVPVAPSAAVVAARTCSSGVAGALALIAALGWVGGWPALESPVAALVSAVLLVASAVLSGACWRFQQVEWEVVAHHWGRPVRLYRTSDAREFGQVQRALVRALERLGPR
jgi:hypothetical protein